MASGSEGLPARRFAVTKARVAAVIGGLRAGDPAQVEKAILELSRTRKWLAPIAFVAGAFIMLFEGLKLLALNWRLALLEALPAMWAWLATLDLRAHVFRGRGFRHIYGPSLAALIGATITITAVALLLNCIFAFALEVPGVPLIRPAAARARKLLSVIVAFGVAEGALLGVAAFLTGRFGPGWFAISMSVAVGILMFSYVALPSRLLGRREFERRFSRKDKLAAAAISGILGAVVTTPPYAMGRLGVSLLGVRSLLVPAILLLVIGFGLQAGASGSVRAIKMSSKLAVRPSPPQAPSPPVAPAGPQASDAEAGSSTTLPFDTGRQQADHPTG